MNLLSSFVVAYSQTPAERARVKELKREIHEISMELYWGKKQVPVQRVHRRALDFIELSEVKRQVRRRRIWALKTVLSPRFHLRRLGTVCSNISILP